MLVLVPPPQFAGTEPEPRDAIAELDSLLGGISSLSADVTQMIVESGGGLLEESAIRMRLRKPGGFYWETLEPFPELIVTDGRTLWNYQPDLEQVVIEDWDSGRAELAAQLLSGETAGLAGEYRVDLAAVAELRRFELTPLAPDSPHALIVIEFVEDAMEEMRLDHIRLENRNGQQTLWRFANLRRNESLALELFRFEPPPGIEIVDSRGAN